MEMNLKNIINQIKIQETKSQINKTKKKIKIDDPAPKVAKMLASPAASEDNSDDPEYNPENPFSKLTFGFKIGPTYPQSQEEDSNKDQFL